MQTHHNAASTVADGRNGLCSQHYYIQRFQEEAGGWLDLRKFDAQMVPLNARDALLMVTRHEKVLAGIVPMQNALGASSRRIRAVEYFISACDGSRIVTQDFLHKFKIPVQLRQPDPLAWRLRAIQGLLFTLRPLDDILDVRTFGAIQGAQFCC